MKLFIYLYTFIYFRDKCLAVVAAKLLKRIGVMTNFGARLKISLFAALCFFGAFRIPFIFQKRLLQVVITRIL